MADRFVRELETKNTTGLSRTTRWRMEKTGSFPRRYKISPGISAYLESEIADWIEGKKAARQ